MPHILHLGVGNFFRAHVAAYTQASPGWQITGVSFRSPTIRDGLAQQNHRYSLVVKDAQGTDIQTITCLTDMLVASEAIEPVIDAIASAKFDVITLTVTEKAYGLATSGQLDIRSDPIRSDLTGHGVSVVGTLVRGLARRTAPVSVVCCDNLPENGAKLAAAARAFADAAGLSLPVDVSFPSTMVDRITPATTEAIRAEADDAMAVPTEAFSEWVIEDDFAGPRPDWPGAQIVPNVGPHEMRKLRMLNGAHSYLAYAGVMRGHDFVHQAVADPVLRPQVRALMAEAADTLPPTVQAQAKTYADALIQRFENPNLEHRLRQIAMDGSQKLPIRILATLKDRSGTDSPALNAAVRAWIAFVQHEVSTGRPLDDPMADALVKACREPDPEAAVRTLIGG